MSFETTTMGKRATIFALLVLGATGIAVQTLLLRELLVLGGGNEFTLGITLGGWLLAEAAGAFLAGRRRRVVEGAAAPFIAGSILFCLLLPPALFLARTWKTAVGISPDLGVGLAQVALASLATLSLPAALHGWLFVAGCALYGRATGRPATASGSGYLLATLGSLAGGLLTAFLLVPLAPPFPAAALIGSLNLLAALWLGWTTWPGKPPLALFLAAGLLVPLLAGTAPLLERAGLERQWQGKTLLALVNSPYQQLAVVRNGEQLTFYSDGTPLFPLPDPDIGRVEELAHFPLLAHAAPRRVLVLGGGAGGILTEILRHPSVTRIDYVEADPWLLRLVTRHAPDRTLRELADPRLRLLETDARRFVQSSRDRYDVVLLGAPLPLTLQGNRLFTVEFFEALRERLEPDGLMAVTASGSQTYYGNELARINASLLATLRSAFRFVAVVPGDENLYLAGRETVTLDPLLLGARLQERRLALQLISSGHLTDRLDAGQREWLTGTLAPLPPEPNRDHSPRLLLWHLGYRSAQFDPAAGRFLARLGRLEPAALLGGTAAAALLLALIGRCRRFGVLGAIAATGFGGMLLELVLVYAWQTLQGAMYQALALLMTTFMAGLALGSWLANRQLERRAPVRSLFLLGEAGMALTALLVAAVPALPPAAASGGVLALLVLTGLVVGGEFPLAVYLVTEDDAAAATGAVYGADLVGAWLGGMVGGVVLVPALGTVPACLVVLLLKAGTWWGVART